MQHIDRMRPEYRALVHEYGYAVVSDSLSEDIDMLRFSLETWRERRQAELLR